MGQPMTLRPRAVSVRQLPASLDRKTERLFFRDLEIAMNVERPAIVLDCSSVRAFDHAAIHLLLCCLEGAMKRNGDVRLAAVCPSAFEGLQRAGAHRLFRFFDTVDQAVDSFQRRAAAALHIHSPSPVASESAA